MRVQNHRARPSAVRTKTGWYHQRRGRSRGFIRAANRFVTDVVDQDVANRRAAERQQLLIGREVELKQQTRRCERGQKLDWVLQQRSARRSGGNAGVRVADATTTPPAAAGGQQQCCEKRRRPALDWLHTG